MIIAISVDDVIVINIIALLFIVIVIVAVTKAVSVISQYVYHWCKLVYVWSEISTAIVIISHSIRPLFSF